MIPVYQTITKPPRGNCFAACIASILETELKNVPNFCESDWSDRWREWLYAELGLTIDAFGKGEQGIWTTAYNIAGVKSPSGDWMHAVVFKGDKFIHDPNPNYDIEWTKEDVVDFFLIYPIDPMCTYPVPTRVDRSREHKP